MVDPSQVLDEAFRLFQNQDIPSASQRVNAVLEQIPEHAPALQLKGLILKHLGKFEEAITAFETASRSDVLPCGVQRAFARCYAQTGKRDVAIWMVRDLAKQEDCKKETLAELACDLGEFGDSSGALEICQGLLAKHPNCPKAAFGVAYYMNRLNYPAEEILPMLEQAYRASPTTVSFAVGYAFCLDRLGRPYEAQGILGAISPADIFWPHCLNRMMEIFLTTNDRPRYLACHNRLVELVEQTPNPCK